VSEVTMVRIYLKEGGGRLDVLLGFLQKEEGVRGVTAFRGIAGFGTSGELHSASILDMSFELPIVVEFFDSPDKVERILADLRERIEPLHVVSWNAEIQ
jgi:hypothetical protein